MSTAPKFGIVQQKQAETLQPCDILTPEELAERLKVPLSWVYKKSVQGRFPVLRCGRYLRFCWPDVVAWLRERK